MKNFFRIAALFLAFGFAAAFVGCSNAAGGGDNPAPTPTTTTYTVSFDANDGSQNPAKATQIFTAGTPQNLTSIADLGFKRDNFAFAGWALSSAASQAAYADKAEYTGNISITLYAVWTPIYAVTFDSKGGSEVAGQKVTSGQNATRPDDPAKEHFNFAGWCSDENCQTPFDFAAPITAPTTLYAKWSDLPVYAVTFDLNGGKYGSNDSYAQNVETGSKAIRPASAPTKDDNVSADVTTKYSFDNWYADAGCNTLFDFDATTISGPATVYAKWSETKYYAVKIASGIEHGSVSSDATEHIAEGTIVMLTASPSAGYKFGSYSVTDADSNPVTVTDGKFTMPASPVTVSATFTAIEYTVTCGTPENGTVTANKAKAAIGTTVTLTVTASDGYELKNILVKDSNGTNISVTEVAAKTSYSFTMPADNVIVTATFRVAVINIPLTLEAIEAGAKVTLDNKASGPVTYRVNGGQLQTIASGAIMLIWLTNVGDKVCFYGNNSTYGSSDDNMCSNIECSNYCYVYGNVMSLVDSVYYENAKELSDAYTFRKLFYKNKYIKNKSDVGVVLPATTLAEGCYSDMFSGCTSLASAPELPATTLAEGCYGSMFSGCTSLASAPALPATTLAEGCYSSMFYGCTSLVSAPALPATTLADECYNWMFDDCTSLVSAPALPATTLAERCYNWMFYGCTSLASAPALPATTLAERCYFNMFWGCTSLASAPEELPATTLADKCYYQMFYGCTSLVSAPALPATTLAESCYSHMFDGCTSLVSAPALPATNLTDYCYSHMFNGCTSLTSAPELPATTLTDYCYEYMFRKCTSLMVGPVLPAKSARIGAYSHMFYGCWKLESVTCLLRGFYEKCTELWLEDGKKSYPVTFTKAADMNGWERGTSGIPWGWTIVDYQEQE